MFDKIGKDIFPRATKAMLDLAARMEIDVPSAAKMLGKALDQPSEGFTALARATGKFTDAQVNTIKEMVAMGETGKAQAAVLDLVEKKVGGAAEAIGKTLPGQLKIAETAAGNFNEEVGAKLVPTLQNLVQEFPNVAAAVVGVKGAWDKLNISGGELLIAIPLLKTAFAGMGVSMAGLVGASGPIALAIIGIGALAATIYSAVTAIEAFSQKQIATVQANVTATRATDGLIKKAKEYGITLEKGNETQEQFNARLFQSIAQHERVNKAITETTKNQSASEKVVRSHVITLQQQIDKQRALVESLSYQAGKDQELTDATAKLEAMLKKTNVTVDKTAEAWKKLPLSYDAAKQASEEWVSSGEREFEVLVKLANQLGRNVAAVDNLRASTLAFSEIDLSQVMISNNATFEAAAKRADEATVALGKMNEMIAVKTPEALAPAKQAFGELDRQVSTVVTDMGKGIADALIKWEGFGSSMKKIAQEFGTGILRTMFETFFEPFQKLLKDLATPLTEWLQGLADKLTDWFKDLGQKLQDFMGTTLGKILGAVTGAGLAFSGYKTGNKALGAAGGALTGAEIGSLFGPWGTAIGAGVGAVGGWLAGMFGARGQAKVTATGGAEELSANVWQNIIPAVKSGNLSIAEGIAAVNAAWAGYEEFLRANVKDQTVIQRSLDSQRITLTQGLAELESLKDKLKIDEAAAGLAKLGQQFLETGQMTDEFAAAVTNAGGSVEFFTTMTGQIQHLQGLRNELGALKQMVDSFLPKQQTWMENFIETGEITEEMAAKIREAGGDIQQFKKFAEMKSVKSQFESLVAEFNKTGVASEKLLEMIKEFGGNDALKAFEDLQAEARTTGKTIGELAKDSEGSAKTIQDAFDSTSAGINKAFGDAAKQLSDTLAKMDENLGKAIADLQSAMVTMIKDLIDVLLGVPGAAEKAARDANFFLGTIKDREVRINISTHLDTSGLDEAARRAAQLGALNPTQGQPDIFNPVDSGSDRTARDVVISDPRTPRFAVGGIVTRPTLAVVGEAGPEAVVPLKDGGVGNTINIYVSGADPDGLRKMTEEKIAPYLASMLSTNRNGYRVSLQKALKLKEPGAF